FNRGDGVDAVYDAPEEDDLSDASVLRFGEGIEREEVKFRLDDDRNLVVDAGQGDQIAFGEFDADLPSLTPVLGSIEFADDPAMSYEDILEQGFDLEGTNGNDVIYGTGVTDRIEGMDGDDHVLAGEGDDLLHGGEGDDELDGGAGDDILQGGEDNDLLLGGEGDDVLFGGGGSNSLQGGDGDDSIFAGDGDTVIDAVGNNHLDLTAYTALTAANVEITQSQADGADLYLNIHVRDAAHPGTTPDTGGVSVRGALANFGTITLND